MKIKVYGDEDDRPIHDNVVQCVIIVAASPANSSHHSSTEMASQCPSWWKLYHAD